MKHKNKNKGIFVKADETLMRMTDILRDKHCINISQLVRTAIVDAFERLNSNHNAGGKQ